MKMKKLFILIIFSLLLGCSSAPKQIADVVELDFDQPHENCEILFVTSGEGANQEEARNKVKENVISAGGNAVVYTGGMVQLNPETKEIVSYSSSAIIYKCKKP